MPNDNPWGNRGNKPPELNDIVDKIIQKLSSLFSGKKNNNNHSGNEQKNSKFLIILILLFAVGYSLIKSFYLVDPGEEAVVLRLGKFERVEFPGPHLLIPFIEKKYLVATNKVQREEFGFRGSENTRVSFSKELESLMLTADKNVVTINWVVQYFNRDAENYLFRLKEPEETLRAVAEVVLRRLVGNRDFDYVLDNRKKLELETQKEMQTTLDKYDSGMFISDVQLQSVKPPLPVQPAYNEINEADQERTRIVNDAQAVFNSKVQKSEGQALKQIEEAQGYAKERVNNAEGDVARFLSIYEEYKKFKDVTKQRMYIETMKKIIPQIEEVYILDQKNQGTLNLLNLNNKTQGIQK